MGKYDARRGRRSATWSWPTAAWPCSAWRASWPPVWKSTSEFGWAAAVAGTTSRHGTPRHRAVQLRGRRVDGVGRPSLISTQVAAEKIPGSVRSSPSLASRGHAGTMPNPCPRRWTCPWYFRRRAKRASARVTQTAGEKIVDGGRDVRTKEYYIYKTPTGGVGLLERPRRDLERVLREALGLDDLLEARLHERASSRIVLLPRPKGAAEARRHLIIGLVRLDDLVADEGVARAVGGVERSRIGPGAVFTTARYVRVRRLKASWATSFLTVSRASASATPGARTTCSPRARCRRSRRTCPGLLPALL